MGQAAAPPGWHAVGTASQLAPTHCHVSPLFRGDLQPRKSPRQALSSSRNVGCRVPCKAAVAFDTARGRPGRRPCPEAERAQRWRTRRTIAAVRLSPMPTSRLASRSPASSPLASCTTLAGAGRRVSPSHPWIATCNGVADPAQWLLRRRPPIVLVSQLAQAACLPPARTCPMGTTASRAPRSCCDSWHPSHSRSCAGMQPYSNPSSSSRCRHQLRWRLSSSATLRQAAAHRKRPHVEGMPTGLIAGDAKG